MTEKALAQPRWKRRTASSLLFAILAGCGGEGSKPSTPQLSVSPASAAAAPGDPPLTFTATMTGLSGTVTWSLTPERGAGTLSAAAGSTVRYTPPNSVGVAKTATLTAALGDVSQSISISLILLPQFYADPNSGDDDNPGTQARPLKTISQALKRMTVSATKTTVLLAGTYDHDSGETWDYAVPSGLTLKGSSPGVILSGNKDQGFTLGQDTMVSDLTLRGFSTALQASSGKQSLARLTFDHNQYDLSLSDSASATLLDCSSDGAERIILAEGQSQLSVQRGTYGGTKALAAVQGSANVRFSDADLSGGGLSAKESSALYLNRVKLHDFSDPSNVVPAAVMVADSSTRLFISGGTFTNCVKAAILTMGIASIDSARFDKNDMAIVAAGGTLSLTDSSITGSSGSPVTLWKVAFRMRRSLVTGNDSGGIVIIDASGGIDLGIPGNPGENTLKGNRLFNLEMSSSATPRATIYAAGNTWNPRIQESDENGHYPTRTISGPIDPGSSSLSVNFIIVPDVISLQL
jgi:hypothetical protein